MLEKVSAFILRSTQYGPEILVIEHPTAGLQLPAGTIENGEAPETAVLRKVFEETGLKQVEIVKIITETHEFTTPDEAYLMETLRCYAWPAQSAQRFGPLFTRGKRFQVFERKVGFTRIMHEEFDLDKKSAKSVKTIEGWLPSASLTHEIRRLFYLIRVLYETPQNWSHLTDYGETIQIKWLPLIPSPKLNEEQIIWLDFLDGVEIED
jgi:8-oxo-dGTP pyrophosphatase MutT (NUDIX family)